MHLNKQRKFLLSPGSREACVDPPQLYLLVVHLSERNEAERGFSGRAFWISFCANDMYNSFAYFSVGLFIFSF